MKTTYKMSKFNRILLIFVRFANHKPKIEAKRAQFFLHPSQNPIPINSTLSSVGH